MNTALKTSTESTATNMEKQKAAKTNRWVGDRPRKTQIFDRLERAGVEGDRWRGGRVSGGSSPCPRRHASQRAPHLKPPGPSNSAPRHPRAPAPRPPPPQPAPSPNRHTHPKPHPPTRSETLGPTTTSTTTSTPPPHPQRIPHATPHPHPNPEAYNPYSAP